MKIAEFKFIKLSNKLHQKGLFLQVCAMALFGMLASLSLPPLFIFPAIFGFIPFFIHSLLSKSVRQIMWLFWGFAFGWFAASLYWISASLFVDISWQILLLPFSLFGLPAFLAIFWAFAGLFVFICGKTIISRLLFSVLFIGLAELGRSVLFTGFPWNSPSHLILTHVYLSQIASVIGQNGSAFLILLFIVSLCFLYLRSWKLCFLCIMPFIISVFYGYWRIDYGSVPINLELEQNSDYLIRIVQPNIPQNQRWKPEYKDQHIDSLYALSKLKKTSASLIIWPEAAYPSIWPNTKKEFNDIVKKILVNKSELLSGMLRFDLDKKLYNSAILFDTNGDSAGIIDKQKRVPFGEYIPFRDNFPFKNLSLFGNKMDINIGPNKGLLYTKDDIKLGIFICYEIIFPVLFSSKDRPDIIVNLTNDAWFGKTLGPYQHLSQARLRSIEEGLPLVRVANTGISAAFDYKGILVGKINLSEKGILDILLPLKQEATIYSRYRWKITTVLIFILILCSVFLDQNHLRGQKANKF